MDEHLDTEFNERNEILATKACTILTYGGTPRMSTHLGPYVEHTDAILTLESWCDTGLNLLIADSVTGRKLIEIWQGAVIMHQQIPDAIADHIEGMFAVIDEYQENIIFD